MWGRWNSGTERILEVGERGGFGRREPTTRRKDSWRQENHRLGEELRRAGRLGGGSVVGDSRRSARNQANPMTGSRVQQTCKPCAEQTAEVGKNDKGGTRSGVATPNLGKPSVDAHGEVGGGAIFEELQERSPRKPVISVTGDVGSKRTGVSPEGRRRERGACGTAEAVSASRAGPGQPGQGKGQRPTARGALRSENDAAPLPEPTHREATSEPGALCSIL